MYVCVCVCVFVYAFIYIYIYIYRCVCVKNNDSVGRNGVGLLPKAISIDGVLRRIFWVELLIMVHIRPTEKSGLNWTNWTGRSRSPVTTGHQQHHLPTQPPPHWATLPATSTDSPIVLPVSVILIKKGWWLVVVVATE